MQLNHIYTGNARQVLSQFPARSVHTCVTSIPYYGLRSYLPDDHPQKSLELGHEETPEEFVCNMVQVFREVRRVLRNDGTLWLNVGDSYWGGKGASGAARNVKQIERISERESFSRPASCLGEKGKKRVLDGKHPSIKPKDLIGIPWRLALALQADGWYLRQDIVWNKPNPMPESVRDRCTKSHEYIFLLSKSRKYYFDQEAIKEPATGEGPGNQTKKKYDDADEFHRTKTGLVSYADKHRKQRNRAEALFREKGLTLAHVDAIRAVGMGDVGRAKMLQSGSGQNDPELQRLADEAKEALGGYYREFLSNEYRNKRSVWTIATRPFLDAHYAVFPEELIIPCVKAGCPPGGVVLDPFAGSGTTPLVAASHGRKYVGIDLYEKNVAMANRRLLRELGMFATI